MKSCTAKHESAQNCFVGFSFLLFLGSATFISHILKPFLIGRNSIIGLFPFCTCGIHPAGNVLDMTNLYPLGSFCGSFSCRGGEVHTLVFIWSLKE